MPQTLTVREWHAGSQFTGTAINPARALGPSIVFHCHWNEVWLYVIAGKSWHSAQQAVLMSDVRQAWRP